LNKFFKFSQICSSLFCTCDLKITWGWHSPFILCGCSGLSNIVSSYVRYITFISWDKVYSFLRQGFFIPCNMFLIFSPVTVLSSLRYGLSFPKIQSSLFLRYHLQFPSNMVWTIPQLWSSFFFRYGFNISSDMVIISPQIWLSSCLRFAFLCLLICFSYFPRYVLHNFCALSWRKIPKFSQAWWFIFLIL
jgi:hypothetical protein